MTSKVLKSNTSRGPNIISKHRNPIMALTTYNLPNDLMSLKPSQSFVEGGLRTRNSSTKLEGYAYPRALEHTFGAAVVIPTR